MIVDVQFLGIPQIKMNDNEIKISLKKSEAILYYLMINKKCSKNEIANLLWGNKNDNSAKINLRVNLHNLRKSFNGYDVIISEGSFLFLNPEMDITLDIDKFQTDSIDSIDVYKGCFLENFYLKESYEYEEWLYKERLFYKELYIEKLYKSIKHDQTYNSNKFTESLCKTIIEKDKFDERAYRILMQYYFDKGLFNKSIELYNDLVEILNEELSISPDPDTRALFNKSMVSNRHQNKLLAIKENRLFCGREKELMFLNNQLSFHSENKKTNPVIIYGESGIGKSYLIQEFISNIDNSKISILQANCYEEEVNLFLKPWHEIAVKILDLSENGQFEISDYSKKLISSIFTEFRNSEDSDFDSYENEEILYNRALREFMELFSKFVKNRKIILVFEDIQWMDKESYRLLSNIIKENKNIFLLCTCRNSNHKSVGNFITLMNKYTNFHLMKILRFTEKETIELIKMKVMKSRIEKINPNIIFKESEGNPFFLNHILTNINEENGDIVNLDKIKNTLQCRFLGVSEEGRKLLNIISIFYDDVNFEILAKMTNRDELEILDLIDELEYKDLIYETTILGKLYLKINHNKLREFLYLDQPEWKRKILHNKAAELIENILEKRQYNFNQYSKLIYHYSSAKNLKKEFKYTLLYLESIMYLKHEFNYVGIFSGSSDSHILGNEILNLFNKLKKMLKNIKVNDYTEEIIKLEIMYHYVLGRFYVMGGEYDKCIKTINELINKATEVKDYEYIIKGYKIMIFYGIEVYDPSIIEKYVNMGLVLLDENPFEREMYLFVRYIGVYQLMKGLYNESNENLMKSTRLIESISKKQPIDYIELARNYYYLGELNRKKGKFDKAISLFDKATETCIKNNLGSGLAQFKVKAGQASFDKGDYPSAIAYFEDSILIYNNYGTSWNRSIAEGYLALIYIYDHKYTKAIRSLKRADRFCKIFNNLYELGVIYRIKAEIRHLMNKESKLSNIFSDYLNLDFDEYFIKAIELFNKVGNCHETDVILKLKTIN